MKSNSLFIFLKFNSLVKGNFTCTYAAVAKFSCGRSIPADSLLWSWDKSTPNIWWTTSEFCEISIPASNPRTLDASSKVLPAEPARTIANIAARLVGEKTMLSRCSIKDTPRVLWISRSTSRPNFSTPLAMILFTCNIIPNTLLSTFNSICSYILLMENLLNFLNKYLLRKFPLIWKRNVLV